MVDVGDSSLQKDSQPKSVGLVRGSAATWHYRVNSRNDLCHDDSSINSSIKIVIIIKLLLLFFFTLGIKDPEGFGKN